MVEANDSPSMTSPPPAPQLSSFPSIGNPSGSSSGKSHQSAWGPSQSQSLARRVTPISTSIGQNSPRPTNTLQSPRNSERNLWSPASSTFPPLSGTSSRQGLRSPSSSNTNSLFSPPSIGQHQQQPAQLSGLLSSARPRTIAPLASSQSASAAAITQGTSLGGTSSGGSTRNFRASPSIIQSNFSLPSPSSLTALGQGTGQTGQLSKIVVAQLFLLLSTLKEDKDKSKWESQVDQIKKVYRRRAVLQS